jgi:hypothetical protein
MSVQHTQIRNWSPEWMRKKLSCVSLRGASARAAVLFSFLCALLSLASAPLAFAQASAAPTAPAAPLASGKSTISPDQEKQLFSVVDELLKFSSQETGLPIQGEVKRQITSRDAVETYLKQKFDEDEDAKRMQSSEIVLKKFGLLDRDFNLKPFLLALLKEQIEAYYDAKTKSVYMLDWVDIDEQKPVLAHELTHALQDQHVGLEKWSDQTPADVSLTAADDRDHLARDEMDTAREAVVEGQATAVMMDYILRPLGKSLVKDPEVIDGVKDQMTGAGDSPILARAPILLSESLLFPYREGLSFTQDLWMDKGQKAAFAGAMDRPPASTWEIVNPREYERSRIPSVPLLPNIHPLVDKLYRPYDIGQVGQLDVHILAEIFGGDPAASTFTSAWDGGIYWAGQLRSAQTPAEQASIGSIAFFYLSAWKNEASARAFARLYAENLARKYSGVKFVQTDAQGPIHDGGPVHAEDPIHSEDTEQVYSTAEGPVLITTRGRRVFVSESFDLALARKLAGRVLDAQGGGAMEETLAAPPASLTAPLAGFFSQCGVMKAAVDAALRLAR